MSRRWEARGVLHDIASGNGSTTWSSTRATTWIAPPTSTGGWASRSPSAATIRWARSNHLAMFGTDYLELIARAEGRHDRPPRPAEFPVRAERAGVRLGGFGGHLRASSPRRACRSSRRSSSRGRSNMPAARRDARFRTVRMKNGVVPYGRVYYCHHFTRDLVWRDEWRHHGNGAVAVAARPDRRARSGGGRQALCRHVRRRRAVRDIKGGKTVVDRQFALRHRDRGDAQGASSATPRPTPRAARPTWPGLTFRTASARQGGAAPCRTARSAACIESAGRAGRAGQAGRERACWSSSNRFVAGVVGTTLGSGVKGSWNITIASRQAMRARGQNS